MTFEEAVYNILPQATKVRVKETGKVLLVRLKKLRKDEKKDEKDMILLKLDDGTWYTNEEVEMV